MKKLNRILSVFAVMLVLLNSVPFYVFAAPGDPIALHINIDELVDINTVFINKNLPKQEKIVEYNRQIKNPYCFKSGKFIITARFSGDGVTMEERVKGFLI